MKRVKFQCVAAGAAHTVAVAVGGAVYTCGRGITTGSGETADRLKMAPVQALDGVPAVACGAGAGHTGVVSEEGDVYVWGWGGHGQLGHGALSCLSLYLRVFKLLGMFDVDCDGCRRNSEFHCVGTCTTRVRLDPVYGRRNTSPARMALRKKRLAVVPAATTLCA